MRDYCVVDVFGETPYAGNPVAVVLDADDLSSERMQRFAAWTNLSETTFVLPPSAPGADYRVRIFTPVAELPFAGHPTLGACHAWLHARSGARRAPTREREPHGDGEAHGDGEPREVVQECAAGLVRVRAGERRLAFAAPPLLRDGPVDEHVVAHVASALNVERAAIVDAQWVDNGPGWVAVMLRDAAAVLAMRPGYVDLNVGVVGAYPPGSPCAFEVRAFFPNDRTTVEDPVTGSLNASLAPWLLDSGRAHAPYVVSQGAALGRRGRVHVDRDRHGTVWVGGATVTCVVGRAEL